MTATWLVVSFVVCSVVSGKLLIELQNHSAGYASTLNLVPFNGYTAREFLKNLLLLAPIACGLAPIIGNRFRIWVVTGIGAGLLVELIELIHGGRVVDISDFIMNTVGYVVTGLAITSVLSFQLRKSRRQL